MHRKKWVVNASPLIILAKVDQIFNRLPKVGFRIQPAILAAAKKLAHE